MLWLMEINHEEACQNVSPATWYTLGDINSAFSERELCDIRTFDRTAILPPEARSLRGYESTVQTVLPCH